MKKTLYLDCPAGLSGDMTVAALLDLGADREVLERALKSIPAKGFETKISRVKKAGIDCCDFDVILDAAHENHDHDMAYLYGPAASEEVHDHEHHHHEEEHHHGDHDHEEEHHHHDHDQDEHGLGHHHHHEHRNYRDVLRILEQTDMTGSARKLAERIFSILAEAESEAHGVPAEEVHFHEVGAVDSIVDITAAAVCFDSLGITDVIIPRLGEGTGTVRCMHGVLPVPVPATANIVRDHGLNLCPVEERGEFLTPTGAAIAAAVITSDHLPARYRILKTGIGAGKRTYQHVNIVRAMLIEPEEAETERRDTIWKLESNVDDSTGEQLGFVMEELLRAGARDVHYVPVFMKKNRPAWLLCVICKEEDIPEMEDIIFRQTTTIGIRRTEMERTILPRENLHVRGDGWEADVKVCERGGEKRFYPEYDSVARICREQGRSFGDVYREVASAASKNEKQDIEK